MTINGDTIPADRYCPKDTILFDFIVKDTNIPDFIFKWYNDYTLTPVDTTPIKIAFPIKASYPNITSYRVSLFFESPTDTTFKDTLSTIIMVDYIRTLDTVTVCQGRDITVVNAFGDSLKYFNVQSSFLTPWDTLPSVSGCDSLVCWYISMKDYITEEYSISSCDSVIWGDGTNDLSFPSQIIVKRPYDAEGDYKMPPVERIFYAIDPKLSCDTLRILTVTIIDTGKLKVTFDQNVFCSGDDMEGTINLETNFTAFDWTYLDKDSLFTVFENSISIEEPGYYGVRAYMDTLLCDTFKTKGDYLRIVNCYKDTVLLVEDCPVVIPNVITPNNPPDGSNDILGIKKLNPIRENELTIYDRWGKNVYQKKNYQCLFKAGDYHNIDGAFDGTSRDGQKLPEGTYYYAFKYKSIPKEKTYTGIIMILR